MIGVLAVDIIKSNMELYAFRMLARIPLYNLEHLGVNGMVVKLMLKDVRVGEGEVVIDFSLLQLMLKGIFILPF